MLDQLSPALQVSALSIRDADPAARFILRYRGDVSRVTAIELPQAPCRASTFGARAALWLGPDEWLLLTAESDVAVLRLAIVDTLAGEAYSCVDISDRQTGLRISGHDAADLINVFCPLDLHPAAFPVGSCTRTIFAKAEIVLWRTAASTFHIDVWRSFAPYVRGLLDEAAGEFTRVI